MKSHTTVIIPFDDRVIFISLLNCVQFSSPLSEVAQTLQAISQFQFLVGGRGSQAVASWRGLSQNSLGIGLYVIGASSNVPFQEA